MRRMVDQIAEDTAAKLLDAWRYENDMAWEAERSPEWDPYKDPKTLTHLLAYKLVDKQYLMRESDEDDGRLEYLAARICLRRGDNGPMIWVDTSDNMIEVIWNMSIARTMMSMVVGDWIDESLAGWLGKCRRVKE